MHLQACRQLSESIEGERSSASFACGGTIPITGDANSGGGGSATAASDSTRRTSPPVSIFWSTATDSNARKLVLPLSDTEESSPSVLRQLVTDCSPATFGKGNKDVLDPSYRMAGKLDPDRFSSSFHPANFGIVENIEQILLPSVSTDLENALQFRRLTADLYKLNVLSQSPLYYMNCADLCRFTRGLLAFSASMLILPVRRARLACSSSACLVSSKAEI